MALLKSAALPYRARKGGREHDRLAGGPDVAVNATDLGFEPHVKHPIRLVKHQIGHPPHVGDLAAASDEDVNHPARRAHDNLGPALELRDLICNARASIDGDDQHVVHLAKLFGVFADLLDEFSGGRHDQGYWAIPLLQGGLVLDVPQHGQHKGKSLTRPCLSNANAIPARHDDWQGLGLDWHRGVKA